MKRLTALILAILLLVSATGLVYASGNQEVKPETVGIQSSGEVTEWVYRVLGGQLQMRLWSNTQGIWLTDWINIG